MLFWEAKRAKISGSFSEKYKKVLIGNKISGKAVMGFDEVDGSELDEGNTKKNENYLNRCYNKEKEVTKY